jgi:signal transduction histidine kinase
MEARTTYNTPLLRALEEAAPHDHLSLIYEGAEDHYAVPSRFLRLGLERGDKCVYIADDGTEPAVRKAMHSHGIDVEAAIAGRSLVLTTKEGAFLRHGSFDPESMMTFWREATSEAMNEGFGGLRATGETEWILCGAPGLDRWIEYESRLSDVLEELTCFALCQYNRQVLPSQIVLDVIRTHPTVIYDGVVCQNLYHVPSDEFLATNQSAREVERLLLNIRERAEIESTLQQQRNQIRAFANRLMHAQDEERRRLAQMLHETTAQNLASLKMLLSKLNRTAATLDESEREALAESIALADQSMSEIRTVSYLLHPPFLDETGLLSALRWYATGFAERSGIRVELDVPERLERLPLDTETALFRVVQESLSNIHRHSASRTARIRLRRDAEALVMEIEDRGRGMAKTSLMEIKSGKGRVGVGIAGMSERIKQLGGRFEVMSNDRGKTGTTVSVHLPVETDAA